MPTRAEIAPYIGEWRGTQWMNPAAPSDVALRIRLEGAPPLIALIKDQVDKMKALGDH